MHPIGTLFNCQPYFNNAYMDDWEAITGCQFNVLDLVPQPRLDCSYLAEWFGVILPVIMYVFTVYTAGNIGREFILAT